MDLESLSVSFSRHPWGSLISNSDLIGNLSSERVSKREVFDLFHRFGRLAQISLKSAYGFVQYHTVTDAQSAMQHAQGAELGGRKIRKWLLRLSSPPYKVQVLTFY
jgi:RNA recognition motif-containing protein